MAEVRNALSKALADGLYLRLDASNDPVTQNLDLQNIGIAGTSSTNTHMLIGSKVYTNEGSTVIGLGCFPEFSPTAAASNVIVSIQGNTWFGTTNWNVDSFIRSLDFFPAPTGSGVGSANLTTVGINTGGLLNIVGRTVTLKEVTAIIAVPIAHLDFGFPFTDNTSCDVARGVWVYPCATTLGTWGRLTGIEVAKSEEGVVNQGIWLRDDGIGADIVFGAGTGTIGDARIYYSGSVLIIQTDIIAASDLDVDCGTEKTVRLVETVWDDINAGGLSLQGPPGQQPDIEQILDEAGAGTGIYTYAIDIGEEVHGVFELQHWYKEGTDVKPHVHFSIQAAVGGATDNVEWELTYTVTRPGETVDASVTIAIEDTVDTQYEEYIFIFPDIDGSGYGIGDQFQFKLERVAATSGDDYGGDLFLKTFGLHCEKDTMGSRQVATK